MYLSSNIINVDILYNMISKNGICSGRNLMFGHNIGKVTLSRNNNIQISFERRILTVLTVAHNFLQLFTILAYMINGLA